MPTPTSNSAGETPHRIVSNPRVLGGKPVIEGTRISVQQVLGLIANGMSIDEIVAAYPHVTAADVRAAVAYAQAALRDDIVVEIAS